MVPSSLILIVLVVAFFPGAFSYMLSVPKRRIVNPYFAVVAVDLALMFVTVGVGISDVQIVWLSWVLLAGAILVIPPSVTMYRRARAIVRAREHEQAQRRARGG